MSKLEDYYRLFDMFKGNLTEAQKELLGQLEDQIIAEELLPTIRESLAPSLTALRRNLTLVVDYDPENGIVVKTTREGVVVKETSAKKYDIVTIKPSKTSEPFTRSESIGFSVKFDDGTVINRHTAQLTFIDALKHIGLDRISSWKGETFKGYNLVSSVERKDGSYKWQTAVDGWFVYTNVSNERKMRLLNKIASDFYIGMSIIPDTENKSTNNVTETASRKRAMFTINGGEPMNKRISVWNVVKEYLEKFPETTCDALETVFPSRLQGSYGVFKRLTWIEEQSAAGHDHINRYFVDEDRLLLTGDSEIIAVCTQWGDQFERFVKHVQPMGWIIKQCK